MLFPAFAGLLKPLSPLLLLPGNRDVLDEVWAVWKPWLVLTSKGGNASGEEQRRLAVEGWGSVVRRGGRGEGGERLVGMMVQDVVQEEEEGTVGLKDGVGLVLVEAMKVRQRTLSSVRLREDRSFSPFSRFLLSSCIGSASNASLSIRPPS
jgi:hypothetical protein